MLAVTMVSPAPLTGGAAFRRFSDTLFINEALNKLAKPGAEPRESPKPRVSPLIPAFTSRGLVINLKV